MKSFSQKSKENKKIFRFRNTCLCIVLALFANLLLFYALHWINNFPRRYPAVPQYTAIEVWPPKAEAADKPIQPETIKTYKPVSLDKPLPQPKQFAPLPIVSLQPRLPTWGAQCLSNIPDIATAAVSVAAAGTDTQPVPLSANQTYTVAQVDQPPTIIKAAPPVYPYWAKQRNAQGFVDLRFVVNKEGKVSHIETVRCSDNPRFIQAATDAVEKWLFKPATFNGQSVDVWCTQRIQFRMDD